MKILKKLYIIFLLCFGLSVISFSNITETGIYKEYILKHNPNISNSDLKSIIESVDKYSYQYKVPKILIYSTMKVESNFDKTTHSHANARGVMQVTPVLVKSYKISRDTMDGNIHIGVKYLAECMRAFGLTNNTVAAYNMGVSGVKKKGYSNIKETSNHVKKVRYEIEYLNAQLRRVGM